MCEDNVVEVGTNLRPGKQVHTTNWEKSIRSRIILYTSRWEELRTGSILLT
jgi:hypothetical protein